MKHSPQGTKSGLHIDDLQALGPLEAAVMDVLWKMDEAEPGGWFTVAAVWQIMHDRDFMSTGRTTAYTTIAGTMRRLPLKGLLQENAEMPGTARYGYRVVLSRRAYEHRVVYTTIDALRRDYADVVDEYVRERYPTQQQQPLNRAYQMPHDFSVIS